MKRFSFAITVSALLLAGIFTFSTLRADSSFAVSSLLITALLGVIELSLSFDNAVINARVLRTMAPKWQRRFLTWGIFIAVVGVRLLLPIAIVALVAQLGFGRVLDLAFAHPEQYAAQLNRAHVPISAFGGAFLLLVAFDFLMDEGKERHWLGPIERPLARAGALANAPLLTVLIVLLVATYLLVPRDEQLTALTAGLLGVVLQTLLGGLSALTLDEEGGEVSLTGVARGGALAFLYLELLDASFSLDGVIGAFAITRDVVVIAAGLAIGALFVRSLTLFMVDQGTLESLVFLEHGAHYAIGALALIMLASMSPALEIPEVVTGLVGVTFIGLAALSSRRYQRVIEG